MNPTMHGTSDHGDSRRLASGLSPDLSGQDSGEHPGLHPRTGRSVPGRQTDPSDRRTSDWRSSTSESDTDVPSTGRPMCVSPTLIGSSSRSHQQMQRPEELEQLRSLSIETKRDITGNASRTLMTGLRRPYQRGVTTQGNADDRRETRSTTARHNRWLWAKLLQEEYPSEGYFIPKIAFRDIPKRLMMLLSGADNRRNHSDAVEELQARAREYTRQQLEQMDEWDRAFYQEWTSLVSRNALAFPYPMGEPGEPTGSSKVKLRHSSQRRSVATRDTSPQTRAHMGRDSVGSSPRRQWTSQLGRYEPREQRVLGQDGEGFLT